MSDSPPIVDTTYRQLVGSLMYLSATRPDISFAISYMTHFMTAPKVDHWMTTKHVLHYVKGTSDYGLLYSWSSNPILSGFTDSDWTDSIDDKVSTFGYVFSLRSGAVTWTSKKQQAISLSSTEGEYRGTLKAGCEAVWLRRMLGDMQMSPAGLTTLFVDNEEGASIMVDSSVSSPRRMLSLSRERAFVSILDDDKDGKAVLSNKQGANTSEVYGFVGSISTIVVVGLFFLWAYLPEPWLHYLGITYYPSRYWALALPTYALVTIIFIVSFYISLNCMATVPTTSWNSLFVSWLACEFADEHTRESSKKLSGHASTNDEDPIDPISDIRITEINARMFGTHK